ELLRGRADLFFGTNFLGVFHRSFKTVLVIYDLAIKYYPETIHPRMLRVLSRSLAEDSLRADAIFTISESTRRDVINHLRVPPEKTQVIYCGVGDEFRPVEEANLLAAVRERYHLPRRFILFVGSIEPRKNLVRLLEAFSRLGEDPHFEHSLVLVGPTGWRDKAIFNTLETSKVKDRVILTGH